jgi:23S rRNA pseudouridine1911/1915/1917 synthase
LDRWLAAGVGTSRARLQQLIQGGWVRVDGETVRPATRLRAGQRVEYAEPPPEPAEPLPEPLPLRIVHEDSSLLVVDKPAGLVVHPGAGARSGTLVNALLHHVDRLSGIGGVARPGIVHRLDKGTSGLIVVAKDDLAHRELSRQFAAREVEKEYLALALGRPRTDRGEIDLPIGRHPVHRHRMSTRSSGPGRAARSSFEVRERLDGASLLTVRIHTGRTHQIRVHLASIGHPVVGDATYGAGRRPVCRDPAAGAALTAFPRPALHAARLRFTHPATGDTLDLRAPLPADIGALLAALRGAASAGRA